MTDQHEEEEDGPVAYLADMSDFKPDPENMNLHTERGLRMVTDSQQNHGYARPAFAAIDGTVLGGNLSTLEVAVELGIGEGKVFVVESSGDIPIIHKRRDIEPGSPDAVLLAAEDNHSSVVSINIDPNMLALHVEKGIDFSDVFFPEEMEEYMDEPPVIEFPNYGPGIENDVKMVTCPHCGEKFPT